jgi:hypothetical protein
LASQLKWIPETRLCGGDFFVAPGRHEIEASSKYQLTLLPKISDDVAISVHSYYNIMRLVHITKILLLRFEFSGGVHA